MPRAIGNFAQMSCPHHDNVVMVFTNSKKRMVSKKIVGIGHSSTKKVDEMSYVKKIRSSAIGKLIGLVLSCIWGFIVILILFLFIETRQGIPIEDGFYKAFIAGTVISASIFILFETPLNGLFTKIVNIIPYINSLVMVIFKLAYYIFVVPGMFIGEIFVFLFPKRFFIK